MIELSTHFSDLEKTALFAVPDVPFEVDDVRVLGGVALLLGEAVVVVALPARRRRPLLLPPGSPEGFTGSWQRTCTLEHTSQKRCAQDVIMAGPSN